MNFNYSFPSIRGYQANKEFFTLMCPLDVLSKLFLFFNNEIPDEFRAQRVLNEKRIPEIRDYILNNPSDYVFSSITASIDGEYTFIPISEEFHDIGTLTISMASNLLINDGQHRKAAIDEALKDNPLLKNETISVVLFVDQGLKKSQQMFSDLNRHAVNVSSSLSILYNHRDPEIELTKQYLKENVRLRKYIDQSSTSLAQKSNKMFLLSIFHKAFINSIGGISNSHDTNAINFSHKYWNALCEDFNEWKPVISGHVSSSNARQSSLATYGIVLEALGSIGYNIYTFDPKLISTFVNKLNLIDWSKTNKSDWFNRCIQPTGHIHKSQKSTRLTFIRIKTLIGLPLTESDQRIEDQFRKENNYGN